MLARELIMATNWKVRLPQLAQSPYMYLLIQAVNLETRFTAAFGQGFTKSNIFHIPRKRPKTYHYIDSSYQSLHFENAMVQT